MALAAIKGDRTLAQLAKQFDLHANQITSWKAQLEGGAADVFGRGGGNRVMQPTVDEVAAREVRSADAGERFLRNGDTSFGLQGLENKPECLGTPVQIVDHPRAVACLVR